MLEGSGLTCFVQQGDRLLPGVDGEDLSRPPLAVVWPEQLQPLACQRLVDVGQLQRQLLLRGLLPALQGQ